MKVNPDASYQFFGAEAVIRRLRALTKLIEGVCHSGDIEYVHKMRVASRRLRTGLGMFKECFPPDRRKDWRRVIENVTQHLGPARDLDVQIEYVRRFTQDHDDPVLQPGLLRFLHHLQTQRTELQDEVARAVKQLRKEPMLRELRKHLRRLRRTSRAGWQEQFAERYSDDARAIAQRKILRRYREFLAYEGFVPDPSACLELHQMRIAGKQLRYAMELFDPFWLGGLKGYTETIREFQQLLGEMHDCDVWIETLPVALREQRQIAPSQTFETLAPGLQALLNDRRSRREELYRDFHRRYREAQAKGFWESLLSALNHPPANAPVFTKETE